MQLNTILRLCGSMGQQSIMNEYPINVGSLYCNCLIYCSALNKVQLTKVVIYFQLLIFPPSKSKTKFIYFP